MYIPVIYSVRKPAPSKVLKINNRDPAAGETLALQVSGAFTKVGKNAAGALTVLVNLGDISYIQAEFLGSPEYKEIEEFSWR